MAFGSLQPERPILVPRQVAQAIQTIVSVRHLDQATIAQRHNTTAHLHRAAALLAATLRVIHHRTVAAIQVVRAAVETAVAEEAVVAVVAVKGTFNPCKVFF